MGLPNNTEVHFINV